MASLADLYITVHPDVRGVDKVMVRSGQESGRKWGAGFRDVSKIAIGNALATVLEGSARAVGRGVKSAIKAGSDLNETLNKSNVIFGKNAKSIEQWSNTADTAFGLSKQQALAAASSFGDMFKQIGFTGDASAKMSKRVVQLSADLGSFNNLGTEDVQDRIAAAFRGEYDSLQKVIPNINAARVQQVALATTGKKAASSLTAQEKAAAVLAIVEKDGARASGDFARTQGGLANQMKIAKAQVDNLAGTIGIALQPVLQVAMKFITTTVLPVVQRLADRLGKWLPGALLAAQTAIRSFFTTLRTGKTEQDIATPFERLAFAARAIGRVLRPVIDTVKLFIGTITGEGADVDLPWMNQVIDLGAQVSNVLRRIGDFAQTTLLPALKDLGTFVLTTVLPAWIAWEKFIAGQLWPIIKQLATFFVTNVVPALQVVAGFIITEVVPGFLQIVGVVKQLLAVVLPIISQIVGVILGKFNEMRPQIMTIWTNIKEIITGVMFVIKEVVQAVTTIVRLIWEKWGTQIKQFIGLIFEGIINIIGGAMKIIAGVIKLIVALIKGDWSGAWNAIKQIFAGVWQAIKGILQVVTAALWVTLQIWWTKVKELWTSATGKIRTTWSNFWANVKRVASDMINSVRTTISNVLGKIRDGFATAVNAIARAWSRIQAAVRDPIKFVIETVLDKGILGAVRAISKFVNYKAGENIHVSLPKGWGSTVAVASAGRLASGGVLPGYTPGRDVHRFYSATGGVLDLSGGEGIARPEIVRAIGKKRWDAANKAARNSRIDDAMHYLGGHASGTSGINAAKNYASSIGLGRGSTYPGHGELGSNLAWDFMTGNRSKGEQLANWAWANAKAIHLWYEIYYRRIRSMTRPGAGWRPYTRYGANASPSQAHTNHVHLSFYRAALGALSGGLVGAGSGQAGGGGGGLAALDPSKYLKMVTDALGKLKSIKGSPFGQMVASVANLLGDKIKAKITDLAASFMAPTPGAAGGKFTAAGGGSNRAIGHRMMLQRWSEANWPALNSLWTRESGWRTTARNPSSGAYGIPQSLPASKMASAGSDWRTNPATQIKWGLGYIAGRYGSPIGAWAHSQRTGWYDRGGMLPPGATMAYNNTGRDELITPLPRGWSLADQDDKLDQLIAVLSTGPRPLIDSVHWHSEGTVHDDMEELAFQLRRLDRGGVYR